MAAAPLESFWSFVNWFHVGAGITGVAPHYTPSPTNLHVAFISYWFDNLGFLLRENLLLGLLTPTRQQCASLSKATDPYWASYGVEGRGFTCCDVPEDWGWRVQKINPSDFAMFFPSKESLRMAIRGGVLTLPTSKLHIIVTSSAGDPAAVEQLEECWIKLFDVPPPYRQAVRILLATRELGRPIAVDAQSLESPLAPVRVLIGCRALIRLPQFTVLFVNSQGFKVRIAREEGEREEPSDPPPPQRKLSEDREEELEESEEKAGTGEGASMPKRTKARPRAGVARMLQPAIAPAESSGERVALSPSLVSFQDSPLAGGESVKSRPSLWKVQQLSDEDRIKAGIATPVTWESDPLAMRSKERRSKANADRPSLALKLVAQQLSFNEGDAATPDPEVREPRRIEERALEGELWEEGVAVEELAAPISRAPRSRASPVAAARTSA
ncbi:hypothetical protein QYE76_032415 [Lolium multiflorum]|uniref:DUF4283 domain-containing protein n=1 Tax=Lolium multiflorum TaxID=4521 RepID=A0AAD8QVQ5_LOLMU|nr:hypothetical protein QYE76_032415 [Lolium multiflorum]